MLAIYFDKKLELKDLPKPKIKKGESLIKIHIAGICNTDIEITKGYMNFRGIVGHEFTGVVEKGTFTGRRVVGEINLGCGYCDFCKKDLSRHCTNRSVLGIYKKNGAFADYITLPHKNLHPIPDNLSNEEAVFTEPTAAGMEIFEQVKIFPSDRTAVVGDGKLGQIIAQIVKLTGCYIKVYGKNEKKMELLEKLNINTDIFNNVIKHKYDFVIECSGSPKGFETALKLVKSRGVIILKSTFVNSLKIETSKLVVDEITILGSRCGRFQPALRLLENRLIKVDYLISKIFSADQFKKAFNYAKRKDSLKVLLKFD